MSEIRYIVPMDDEEDSPSIELSVDDDNDVLISQMGNHVYPTYRQAFALHQALGQLLIRVDRAIGEPKVPLRLVS